MVIATHEAGRFSNHNVGWPVIDSHWSARQARYLKHDLAPSRMDGPSRLLLLDWREWQVRLYGTFLEAVAELQQLFGQPAHSSAAQLQHGSAARAVERGSSLQYCDEG